MNSVARKARFVQGFVERSIASSASPTETEELRVILANQPESAAKKIGIGVFRASLRFPTAASTLIGRQLPDGVSYAGAGSQSVVYRVRDEVVKVNVTSIYATEADRQALASSESAAYALMQQYLGKLVMPQAVSVGQHPVSPKLRAVQLRQPFVHYDDLGDVFSPYKDSINRSGLQNLLRNCPAVDEALHTLADQGLVMASTEGYAPDILRRGNVGILHNPQSPLRVIDTQPVPTHRDNVQDYLLPQLEDLKSYLAPAVAA